MMNTVEALKVNRLLLTEFPLEEKNWIELDWINWYWVPCYGIIWIWMQTRYHSTKSKHSCWSGMDTFQARRRHEEEEEAFVHQELWRSLQRKFNSWVLQLLIYLFQFTVHGPRELIGYNLAGIALTVIFNWGRIPATRNGIIDYFKMEHVEDAWSQTFQNHILSPYVSSYPLLIK